MGWTRRILPWLVPALLVACTTRPITDTKVPPLSYFERAANTGTVTVRREAGFGGGGTTIELLVDGRPAARLLRSDGIVLHLPAGDHILSAQTSVTGSFPSPFAEVQAHVAAGCHLTFRIGGQGGDVSIVQLN